MTKAAATPLGEGQRLGFLEFHIRNLHYLHLGETSTLAQDETLVPTNVPVHPHDDTDTAPVVLIDQATDDIGIQTITAVHQHVTTLLGLDVVLALNPLGRETTARLDGGGIAVRQLDGEEQRHDLPPVLQLDIARRVKVEASRQRSGLARNDRRGRQPLNPHLHPRPPSPNACKP